MGRLLEFVRRCWHAQMTPTAPLHVAVVHALAWTVSPLLPTLVQSACLDANQLAPSR